MSFSLITCLHVAQYAGFVGAQITNAALLFLIFTRAERLFGSYRHVMAVFASYSLGYTWIELLTQPIMHIHGSAFIVMMDGPLKYDTWIGNDVTSLYCGSSAFCIAFLAAQFFYRYIAVCKPADLKKLSGFKVTIVFIPCFLIFAGWHSCVHFGMHNTKQKQEFLRNVMMENYGEDTRNVSFIAAMYWGIDGRGEAVWNVEDVLGYLGCTMILGVCSSTIIFCVVSIYRKLKDAQNVMSAKTKELNRQLFITLSFQTILPFVMLYAPVGLIITLPMLEIEVGKMANLCGALAGIYPAIEPTIAIFCIKDFRRAVLCQGKLQVKPNSYLQNSDTRATSEVPSISLNV